MWKGERVSEALREQERWALDVREVEGGANRRPDPVHVAVLTSPAEDEEGDRDERHGEQGEAKALLGRDFPVVLVVLRHEVATVVLDVDEDRDGARDEEAEERQGRNADVEPPLLGEDDGEGLRVDRSQRWLLRMRSRRTYLEPQVEDGCEGE